MQDFGIVLLRKQALHEAKKALQTGHGRFEFMTGHADKGIFALLEGFTLSDIQHEADAGLTVFHAGHCDQHRHVRAAFLWQHRLLRLCSAGSLARLEHQ